MASIPKANISDGNTIQPADIKNIVDALDGTTSYDITMKGTLNITGSVITGSISNAVSSSYSFTSSIATSASYAASASYVVSSSYAASASYARSSSYSSTSSLALSSSYSQTSSNCTVDDGTIWMLSKDSSFVGGPVVTISGSRNGKTQPSLLIYGKLQQQISGTRNTLIGEGAGENMNASVTEQNNTAIGTYALLTINDGAHTNNTAIGSNTLYHNVTSSNTALGAFAGKRTTTGHDNTYIGSNAGSGSLSGRYNVAIGSEALRSNTSSSNTAVGYQAGSTNTTGWNNTFLGNGATGATIAASHSITLGNSSIATLRCQQTTITALSDERDKKDIVPLNLGLDFVNELNPVTFTWNMRDGGRVDVPDLGFIAQDLQALEDKWEVSKNTQLVYNVNPDRLEATWGRLLPIAIKAIQELSQQNEELKDRLNKAGL